MENRAKYLVSACLCGIPCRYDGKSAKNGRIVKLVRAGKALPICPEVLGGLSVPRQKSEIVGGDGKDVIDRRAMVISRHGEDYTPFFLHGAVASLFIAGNFQI
jgi:uncharacterized protein YbbK (DUF523 family)